MVQAARLSEVRGFIDELYGSDLHAKRVDALAGATLGVMTGASLAVAMIGQALAQARGLVTKQVDRLMSNAGIAVWDSFACWVPQQVSGRSDILVAMNWTDFDHDGQSTLVLGLVNSHGRAAPLIWFSVWKEEVATRRNDYEDACLRRLAETLPPGCRATILADRGFGDQKLFAFLDELGFGYVIRFRDNIRVADARGETRPAAEWVGRGGRARKLRHARVTAKGQQVGAVVCVHAKGMKEPWCLAASDPEATAAVLVNHYAKRWTIEPAFRDTKDLRRGQLPRTVARSAQAELVQVDALPPHRDLDDAVQLTQRAGARHQHAPPHHRADPEQPNLDLHSLGPVGVGGRRGSSNERSGMLRRSCHLTNLTPVAPMGTSTPTLPDALHNLGSRTQGHHEQPDASDFREDPGAGKPPARICEGGAEWRRHSTTTCRQ